MPNLDRLTALLAADANPAVRDGMAFLAVRMFLACVVAEQAIPFPVKVPNATTIAAMEGARRMGSEGCKVSKDWSANPPAPRTASSKRAGIPRASELGTQFRKNWVPLDRSGQYDMHRLRTAMMTLVAGGPLPTERRDHALAGEG